MFDYFNNFKNLINFKFNYGHPTTYLFTITSTAESNENNKHKGKEQFRPLGIEIGINGNISLKPKIQNHKLGFILLEFLNNFELIYSCCKKYEEKINNSSEIGEFKTADDYADFFTVSYILEDLIEELAKIKKIKHCSSILINDIKTFNTNFITQITKYTDQLHKEIQIAEIEKAKEEFNKANALIAEDCMQEEQCCAKDCIQVEECGTIYPPVLEEHIQEEKYEAIFAPVSEEYLQAYKQQYEELQNLRFYKNIYLEFIKNFNSLLNDLYNFCINAFIPTEKSKYSIRQTQKYNRNNLIIPTAELVFNNNYDECDNIKIDKFIYKVTTIQELINITFYHIIQNKNVIKKCENCGDYFIPKTRNNEKYCDKYIKVAEDDTKLYCHNVGKYRSYKIKHHNTSQLYKILKERIIKKISSNDSNKEVLEKKLTELINNYDKLKKQYKDKEKQKYEIHKYLVDFDKKFQKEFPSKKGYTSKQYWKYEG